jgi:hypothetical protein
MVCGISLLPQSSILNSTCTSMRCQHLFQLLCNTLCWLLSCDSAVMSAKMSQASAPHLHTQVKAACGSRCQCNQHMMMPNPCCREIQSHVSEPFWYIHVSKGAEPPDTGHCEFTWARGRLFDQDAAVVLYEMCAEQPLARVLEVRGEPCPCCMPSLLHVIIACLLIGS